MEKELKPASATVIVIILTAILFAVAVTTVDAPTGDFGNPQGISDNGGTPDSGLQPSGKDSMVPYTNSEFGISFEYPSSLSMAMMDTPTQNPPELTLNMTKGIPPAVEGGEGPTSIKIHARSNIENLPIESLVRQESTWDVAMTPLIKTEVNGTEAYEYYWSGLYEGRTVIVLKDGKIFTLSVDWMDSEEQIVRDFIMILNTLKV